MCTLRNDGVSMERPSDAVAGSQLRRRELPSAATAIATSTRYLVHDHSSKEATGTSAQTMISDLARIWRFGKHQFDTEQAYTSSAALETCAESATALLGQRRAFSQTSAVSDDEYSSQLLASRHIRAATMQQHNPSTHRAASTRICDYASASPVGAHRRRSTSTLNTTWSCAMEELIEPCKSSRLISGGVVEDPLGGTTNAWLL